MKDIKLLDLDGKALQKELAKIIEESPKHKLWTEKEIQIAIILKKAGVPHRIIAQKLQKSVKSVENKIYKTIQ